MSISISQNPLATSFNQLVNNSKISKKPLNELNKLANNIANIKNGYKHMSELGNTKELTKTFESLKNKLNSQNSKMFEKKSAVLNNIQVKLLDFSSKKELNQLNQLNQQLDKSTAKIESLNKSILPLKAESLSLNNKAQILEEKISMFKEKLNPVDPHGDTPPLSQTAEDKINKLKQEYSQDVTKIKNGLSNQKDNLENKIINLANKFGNISDVKDLLNKVANNSIKDHQDKGFGPTTWQQHITTDKFVMKHFGHNEEFGRRSYSQIKVPNDAGKQFKSLIQDYSNISKELRSINNGNAPINKELSQKINVIKESVGQYTKSALINNIQKLDSKLERVLEEKKPLDYDLKNMTNTLQAEEKNNNEIRAKIDSLK